MKGLNKQSNLNLNKFNQYLDRSATTAGVNSIYFEIINF